MPVTPVTRATKVPKEASLLAKPKFRTLHREVASSPAAIDSRLPNAEVPRAWPNCSRRRTWPG